MSKQRLKRDTEIICICPTYDHPHRLGGGKCTGAEWCQSIREIDSYACQTCNFSSPDSTCDVVTGIEEVGEKCECVAEELRGRQLEEEFGYLPLNVNKYMNDKMESYYEEQEESN